MYPGMNVSRIVMIRPSQDELIFFPAAYSKAVSETISPFVILFASNYYCIKLPLII